LRENVYAALENFNSRNHRLIESVDEEIIRELQEKVENGKKLSHDELIVTASILKGELSYLYKSQKMISQQHISTIHDLQKYSSHAQRFFSLFQNLAKEFDLILAWNINIPESPETCAYDQLVLTNKKIKSTSQKNSDILFNIDLLYWASILYDEGFYESIFSTISQYAEEGFDHCLMEISPNGITLSQNKKSKQILYLESIPEKRQSTIFHFWRCFFDLLDYKSTIIKRAQTLQITWN